MSGMASPKDCDRPSELSQLVANWNPSDAEAQARLMAMIYPELKQIAELRMSRERKDHTLQPTALVNEFFLQLVRQQHVPWKSRGHFLAVASRAMRRLLVDHARARNAEKRGGSGEKLQLEFVDLADRETLFDALEINDLLDRLALEEPRMAQIVELRCFGGLTHREIAEVVDIEERTVKRDWQLARAWLYGQMKGQRGNVDRRMGED